MRVTFGHWMFRQVGYEAMMSGDRRRLHLACADAVESNVLGKPSATAGGTEAVLERLVATGSDDAVSVGTSAEDLARHNEAGGRGYRAGLWLVAGAREAMHQGRLEAAAAAAGRGISLIEPRGPSAALDAARTVAGGAERFCGRHAEALRLYADAEPGCRARGDCLGLARVDRGVGAVRTEITEYDEALRLFRRAHETFRAEGDEAAAAGCRRAIGNVHYERGEVAEALDEYASALAALEPIGGRRGAAYCLQGIGNVRLDLGEVDAARRELERAHAAFEEMGDRRGAGWTLFGMGNAHLEAGDPAAAASCYENGLEILSGIGDRRGRNVGLDALANLRLETCDYAGAESLYAQALVEFQAMRNRRGVASCRRGIATAMLERGETAAARTGLEEALATFRALGAREDVARGIGSLARVDLLEEKWDAAGRALQEAEAISSGAESNAIQAHRLGLRARWLSATGRAADSDETVARLQALARRTPTAAIRLAARFAVGVRRSDPAILAETAASARAMGARYVEAESHLARAAALSSAGDASGARASIAEAAEIAKRHGMNGLYARAREMESRLSA